jgi:hypothetical protein
MRFFKRRKNWYEELTPEQQERFKWAIIAEDLKLPGRSVDEVKKAFEDRLYPPKDAA